MQIIIGCTIFMACHVLEIFIFKVLHNILRTKHERYLEIKVYMQILTSLHLLINSDKKIFEILNNSRALEEDWCEIPLTSIKKHATLPCLGHFDLAQQNVHVLQEKISK